MENFSWLRFHFSLSFVLAFVECRRATPMPSAIPFSCIHVAHTDTRAYTRTDQRKLSFFLIPVGEIQAQVFHDEVNERKKYFNNLTHKLCAIVRLICPVDAQLTRTHTGQTAICIFFPLVSSRHSTWRWTFEFVEKYRIRKKRWKIIVYSQLTFFYRKLPVVLFPFSIETATCFLSFSFSNFLHPRLNRRRSFRSLFRCRCCGNVCTECRRREEKLQLWILNGSEKAMRQWTISVRLLSTQSIVLSSFSTWNKMRVAITRTNRLRFHFVCLRFVWIFLFRL